MAGTEIRELAPQAVACIAATCGLAEIPQLMQQLLPEAWEAVVKSGGVPAGAPYARYLEWQPDHVVFEVGVPVATPFATAGRVVPGELPGGTVAVAVHIGPYDKLADTYAELERWLSGIGRRPAGPMWEVYQTDPGEEPDPARWRTEIFQPIE